jgi:hypothetical protein
MHGTFDKRVQDAKDQLLSWNLALLAIPLIIPIVLIGMAASHPSAGRWIAEAAQAEYVAPPFVGTDLVPDMSPPARMAQPSRDERSGKAL